MLSQPTYTNNITTNGLTPTTTTNPITTPTTNIPSHLSNDIPNRHSIHDRIIPSQDVPRMSLTLPIRTDETEKLWQQIICSHPIWYLQGQTRTSVSHLLHCMGPGVSCYNSVVVCIRF